jgi:predicted ABC-type ATPase
MTPPLNLFVVHLAGPSTSGKSSVFRALAEKLERDIYTVSYDKLKWGLNTYHRNKHKALIKELVIDFFEVTCHKHLPIFLDAFIENELEYQNYKRIAEENGYVFISVELTAPLGVLLTRFRERVENAKLTGGKISITDENIFLSETSKRPFVHENTPVFDTSVESLETITETIGGLITVSVGQTLP